jgi:hypothetical protein
VPLCDWCKWQHAFTPQQAQAYDEVAGVVLALVNEMCAGAMMASVHPGYRFLCICSVGIQQH